MSSGGDANGQPNKVDMSLDDIIKLNRRDARRGGKPGNLSGNIQRRIRVSAVRRRGVRPIRGGGVSSETQLARNQRLMVGTATNKAGNSSARVRPSAAAAVLRRARQTAVAAAKAAADAAALLQRGQRQRQRLFDELRGVRTAVQPTNARANNLRGPIAPRGALQQSLPRGGALPRSSSTIAPAGYRAARVRTFGFAYQQRVRQAASNGESFRLPRRRNGFLPNGSGLQVRGVNRRQRRPRRFMQSFRFTTNSDVTSPRRSVSGRPFNRRNPFGRSRDEEYLAQARALIRAQNELQRQRPSPTFSYATQPTQRQRRLNERQRAPVQQERIVSRGYWFTRR